MNNLSEFFNSLAGKIVIVSFCVMVLMIVLIILINTLHKRGKILNIIVPGKHSIKTTADGKIDVELLKDELFSHKFFTSIKYEYINTPYSFEYHMYDTLVEHSVKNEGELMVEFKKTIANKFLSDCLFKYLEESTSKWILDVLKEYSSSKKAVNPNYIPPSLCNIVESIMRFTNPIGMSAATVEFTFKNKKFEGIPIEFVDKFCNIVNKDITTIQRLFSSIIYSTPHPWYDKIYEILDTYELVLRYIKNSVDSTLIVLNGQMRHYLDELFPLGAKIEEYVDNKPIIQEVVDIDQTTSSSNLQDYLKG